MGRDTPLATLAETLRPHWSQPCPGDSWVSSLFPRSGSPPSILHPHPRWVPGDSAQDPQDPQGPRVVRVGQVPHCPGCCMGSASPPLSLPPFLTSPGLFWLVLYSHRPPPQHTHTTPATWVHQLPSPPCSSPFLPGSTGSLLASGNVTPPPGNLALWPLRRKPRDCRNRPCPSCGGRICVSHFVFTPFYICIPPPPLRTHPGPELGRERRGRVLKGASSRRESPEASQPLHP